MKNARILVVDDEANIRALLEEILSEEGYEVTIAADAEQARKAREQNDYDLILLDIWMPDTDGISLLKEWSEGDALGPVVMMSGHGTVDAAVEATRLGAVDFIEKPVSLAKLLRVVQSALAHRRQSGRRRSLVPPILAPVGKSEAMRRLREQVARVARHDAHTLLTGEPGSGRELFARYLASRSDRADGAFVTVMGGALTDQTCRAQLLGDGEQPGALEKASGGILFINEVQDMPPDAQQLLLGVLEQKEFVPADAASPRPFDARIVASAPPGFERSGGFKRELLSHLSVIVIGVPPLREYAEDVPELLRYHVDSFVDSENLPFRRFSVAAQNRLRNYPWPGNVRELKNMVKRLLILGGSETIELDEVEAQLVSEKIQGEPLVKQDLLAMPLREAREHFERAYLQQQLLLCGGKVGQLAKRVGMERTHLYRKLRSLGVDFRQALSDD
ncbi:MAG: sigma-54-dependent Fis family transcriptional regulator [Gammaproteobacteria bacterium]|nr:sigma-54-dependent Fis family transcriptional regulator [Gammaproteobacteria bacterium]